jgi:L-threonylcarbamoyladenylate synthase
LDLKSFAFKARHAAELMRHGQVIAYPTEAVWGLGCDPFNRAAVYKILALKKRPVEKGLILISGQKEHFLELLKPYSEAKREEFFAAGGTRPVTWLVKDHHNLVPAWVKGSHSSVALRYTRHPMSSLLSKEFGGLLVSTSANPAGMPEARSLYEAQRYFRNGLSMYVQAPLGGSKGVSQIMDLDDGRVLRG